ncbi:MAG: KpsF/GutQ family sugar-phosphate isomerase [Lachnospiraceae bacterium]|nr:KpsF/GutQ family sugar-phosphate isomerase [Lachnospiraceae bacterium]
MDILEEGKRVFNIEIEALQKTRNALDENFINILDLIIGCNGKVIVTGIGKSGHIAAKMASTFASLGTHSFYLHPAEAMHGDLGMISENDVVIAVSYSGESDEIVRIIPSIKMIGATLIGITGHKESTLAAHSDIVQVLPQFDEACYLGLAPTSSTTTVLCYGDALAVTASRIYGYSDIDFGRFHPAGSLGKKLVIKVEDLMASGERNSCVHVDMCMKDAIIELGKKGLGAVSVIDNENRLLGIITDGDLRRQLEKEADVYSMKVQDIMTRTPVVISKNDLAFVALRIMKDKNISCLVVSDNGKAEGIIRLQDIIGIGIIG